MLIRLKTSYSFFLPKYQELSTPLYVLICIYHISF